MTQVATPEGFRRDPKLVQRFYNERRANVKVAKPNEAHVALAKLEDEYSGECLLVTQNIDDLHERAGSRNLIHMHGEINKMRCCTCDSVMESLEEIAEDSICPVCGNKTLRPHIVWFGEIPLKMDEICRHLESCEVFIAIGTSGQVYPAAGFVDMALAARARCIEVNLEATSSKFHERMLGPATGQVARLAENLLAGVGG